MKLNHVPRHIALAPDGNGRWATRQGEPRAKGHRAGTRVLPPIIEAAVASGVQALSMFLFSTENWNRPPEEIRSMMSILATSHAAVKDMHGLGARLGFIGRIDDLPRPVVEAIRWAENLTESNTAIRVYLAINYGGRAELVDATRRLLTVGTQSHQVDEETIVRHLYAPEASDAELLIRTGGQHRLSNFLPWQLAHAEMHVTDTLWPDFTAAEFRQILTRYADNQRLRAVEAVVQQDLHIPEGEYGSAQGQ